MKLGCVARVKDSMTCSVVRHGFRVWSVLRWRQTWRLTTAAAADMEGNNGGGGTSHLYQLLTSGDCKKNGGDPTATKVGNNK